MISFLPLEKLVLDRSPALRKWIEDWASKLGREVEVCIYERGWILDPKVQVWNFFWGPAPAFTIIVVEELRQARQKRTQSAHVLGVPRLLWSEWRRHIYKSVDLIIEIHAECGEIWPREMHETLMLVICFPFLNRCP